jgi:hypothetical protein
MITFNRGKFERNNHMSVSAAHHMTVAEVLAFADRLREVHAPHDTKVYHDTAYSTGHFIGLSARWTEEKEPCEFS